MIFNAMIQAAAASGGGAQVFVGKGIADYASFTVEAIPFTPTGAVCVCLNDNSGIYELVLLPDYGKTFGIDGGQTELEPDFFDGGFAVYTPYGKMFAQGEWLVLAIAE